MVEILRNQLQSVLLEAVFEEFRDFPTCSPEDIFHQKMSELPISTNAQQSIHARCLLPAFTFAFILNLKNRIG